MSSFPLGEIPEHPSSKALPPSSGTSKVTVCHCWWLLPGSFRARPMPASKQETRGCPGLGVSASLSTMQGAAPQPLVSPCRGTLPWDPRLLPARGFPTAGASAQYFGMPTGLCRTDNQWQLQRGGSKDLDWQHLGDASWRKGGEIWFTARTEPSVSSIPA